MHKYLVIRIFDHMERRWHVWADNKREAIRKGQETAGKGRGIDYSAFRV